MELLKIYQEHGPLGLIIFLLHSILWTWGIGLTPALLIRFVFLRRPISKWAATITASLFFFIHLFFSIALGSESKTHVALILVAISSYYILQNEKKESIQKSKDLISPGDTPPPLPIYPPPLPPTLTEAYERQQQEDFYETVAKEMADKNIKRGLWIKAFSEAMGDKSKATAIYIAYRVKQLQEQNNKA